jgi:hypothetical protein
MPFRRPTRAAPIGTYALGSLCARNAGYAVSSIAHEPRVMCAVDPLVNAADAIDHVHGGHTAGKVVLAV